MVDFSLPDTNVEPSAASRISGRYISAIYRHLQILINARLEPFRIGSGQFFFLLMIAAKEGISQKALSEELLIDKATTAKAIRKLEEEGYVYRENDPEDNRYHLIFLTEFGKTSLPKIQKVINDVNKKSRAGIPDEQFELMMELLQKMLFNVSEEVHKLRDGENK